MPLSWYRTPLTAGRPKPPVHETNTPWKSDYVRRFELSMVGVISLVPVTSLDI